MIKNCLKLPLHDKKLPKTAPACSSAKYIHQTAQKSSKNLLIDTKYPLLRRFFDTNYRFFTLFHPLSNVFRHQLSVFHLFFTVFHPSSDFFLRFFTAFSTVIRLFSTVFHRFFTGLKNALCGNPSPLHTKNQPRTGCRQSLFFHFIQKNTALKSHSTTTRNTP